MDKKLFVNRFSTDNVPTWQCPTCRHGTLVLDKDTFRRYEDADSRKHRNSGDWEWGDYSGAFSVVLKCSSNSCGEDVLMAGHVNEEPLVMQIDEPPGYDEQLVSVLNPLLFVPSIRLFNGPPKTPKAICDALDRSFSLLWHDPPSAANKARTAVELIMDHFKVRRYTVVKSKRKPLTLHSRIDEFQKRRPEEGDLLLAIKWIGNGGSHAHQLLQFGHMLIGFELLERVLSMLFDPEPKRLSKMAKSINKSKGILGKQKKF